MNNKNPRRIYAVLGGALLGLGMGWAIGVALNNTTLGSLFAVGLALMWVAVFYAGTRSTDIR